MQPSRRWMLIVLALALAFGAGLGIVGDRLVFADQQSPASENGRSDGVIWFPCYEPTGREVASTPFPEASDEERNAGRESRRKRRMERVRKDLQLDDRQVEQLREVFQEHGQGARQYWQLTRDEYCRMQEALRSDVRALLRTEQIPLFEERIRRLEERAAAHASGHRQHRDGSSDRHESRREARGEAQ